MKARAEVSTGKKKEQNMGQSRELWMTRGKGHPFQQQHCPLSWDSSINKADTHHSGSLHFSGFTFSYLCRISLNAKSSITPFACLMGTTPVPAGCWASALLLQSQQHQAAQVSTVAGDTSSHPMETPPNTGRPPITAGPITYADSTDKKKPSKYEGDDLSLVPEYFQKKSRCLKDSVPVLEKIFSWGFLFSQAHL